MTDKTCTIAVDAMGGDHAPSEIIEEIKLAASIIGHGHSSAEAIKSALFSAITIFERDIQEQIRQEIARYKETS